MGTLHRSLLTLAQEADTQSLPAARILVVDLPDVASEAIWRHHASGASAGALAEMLVATALLSGQIKGQEKLSTQLNCNGAVGSLMADVDGSGGLRGYVREVEVAGVGATLAARTRWSLGGRGEFTVMKSVGTELLYRGAAPMTLRGIGPTLESYLLHSEQVPSLVEVTVDLEDAEVQLARGVLIQALGGSDKERFSREIASVDRQALRQQLVQSPPAEVGEGLFPGALRQPLEPSPLRFACSCGMERALAALSALGADEVEALRLEQGKAEISCHFCRERYVVGSAELVELVELLRRAEGQAASQGSA